MDIGLLKYLTGTSPDITGPGNIPHRDLEITHRTSPGPHRTWKYLTGTLKYLTDLTGTSPDLTGPGNISPGPENTSPDLTGT
jgi:hypothetical protein